MRSTTKRKIPSDKELLKKLHRIELKRRILGYKFVTATIAALITLTVLATIFPNLMPLQSVVILVLLMQLIILWKQAEISKEQKDIEKRRYNPTFALFSELKLVPSLHSLKPKTAITIKMENLGDMPAFNVTYTIRRDRKPNSAILYTVKPHDVKDLFTLELEDFQKESISIDVEFSNLLGEDKIYRFFKPSKGRDFFIQKME